VKITFKLTNSEQTEFLYLSVTFRWVVPLVSLSQWQVLL